MTAAGRAWPKALLIALLALSFTLPAAPARAQDEPGGLAPLAAEGETTLLAQDLTVEPADGGFFVTWRTDAPAPGWVEYGSDPDTLLETAYDVAAPAGDPAAPLTEHRVFVPTADPPGGPGGPAAPLYYIVIAGGSRLDEAGTPFRYLPGGPAAAALASAAPAAPISAEEAQAAAAGDTPNDAPNDADDGRLLYAGAPLAGTISPANDRDSYYFYGAAGQLATLRMDRTSGLLDPILFLYRPDGAFLAGDDNSGDGSNALIYRVSLPQTGLYRVWADGYDDYYTGTYTLSLTLEAGSSGCADITTQYRGEYWNNRSLSGTPALVQCEPRPLSKNWGADAPVPGLGADNFSARFTTRVYLDAGRYIFTAGADDGVRLYLDGVRIIDAWREQGLTFYSHTRDVAAGWHELRVDYFEGLGGAAVQAYWSRISASGNLARDRFAWASSQRSSAYAPRLAVDGRTATRWSSRISSTLGRQWWKLDLGSVQGWDRVVIRWNPAYAADYFVGYSTDDGYYYGNWYAPGAAGSYSHMLGLHNARYLLVLMTVRAPTMDNFSFAEVEVYRTASSSPPALPGVVELAPRQEGAVVRVSPLSADNVVLMPVVRVQ